jgi:hypothetical protein
MRPDSLRELLLFAPVAVYGGYFGAGMSVMLVAWWPSWCSCSRTGIVITVGTILTVICLSQPR